MQIYRHIQKRCTIAFYVVLSAAILSGCSVIAPKQKATRHAVVQKKNAMDLFIKGKVEESKGNYDGAIVQYLEAMQYDPESEEIVRSLAEAFVKDKKLRSALYYTRKAIELNPTNTDTWKLLQWLEQTEGRIEKAAEALEMYIKLTPEVDFVDVLKLAWYYFELGREAEAKDLLFSTIKDEITTAREMNEVANLLNMKGHTEDALTIYKRMVERDPLDGEAWISLAELYNNTHRANEVISTYQNALENNPDNIALLVSFGNYCLEQNDWECAITHFEKAESLANGVLKSKIQKTLCAVYFYAGKERKALTVLDNMIETKRDDAALYFSLGKSMDFLERYEEAVDYFGKGFEHSIDEISERQIFDVYRLYANALIRLNRHDDAIELIHDEASAYIKDRDSLKILEASIYMNMKRYNDAIEIYKWFVDSDPKNVQNILWLAQAYASAKNYKKAEETLMKVSDIDPENVRHLFQLSLIYDSTGQFENAEKALNKVLKMQPNNSLALNNLAYMYIENDTKISKAIDMVKRAIEIQPRNGAYHDTLGWGYYKKRKYQDAKKHIENALKWEETDGKGVIYEHYGDILIKLKMKKDAIEAYRKAIKMGEDKNRIQQKLNELYE